MTTVAQLDASGSGRVVFFLEIAGWPYVFATADIEPLEGDDWYWETYFPDFPLPPVYTELFEGLKPWIIPESIGDTEDLSRFTEGELEVPGVEVAIQDYDGELTAMIMGEAARTSSRLNAALTSSGSTITLIDASGFATSGHAWAGLEAIYHGGKSATTLTGCVRGEYNSPARAYSCDHTIEPPVGIMITDGPVDIRGRPARIHMGVVDDSGTMGATSCVYRGFVGLEINEIGEGIWRIPIEHAWTSVANKNVGQGLPSSDASRGYYYSGVEGSISTVYYQTYDSSTSDFAEYAVTVSEGFYADPAALAYELSVQFLATGADICPYIRVSTEEPEHGEMNLLPDADVKGRVIYGEGSPMWAMGFEAGEIEQEPNTLLIRHSKDKSRAMVIDLTSGGTPQIPVANSDVFTAGCAVQLGNSSWGLVSSASSNIVYLDPWYRDYHRYQLFWSVEADKSGDLVLRHVFAFSPIPSDLDDLTDALKRSLHLYSGQLEPEDWCAFGLTTDDIDFDELDAALAGAPTTLLAMHDALTEPITLGELIGPRLGILGVAPRIIDDGVIGFARVETAIALNAETIELDEDMYHGGEPAGRVRASLGGEGCITQAVVKFGHDYRDDKWAPEIEITWDDGIATVGRKRAVSYDLRGVDVSPSFPAMAANRAELRTTLVSWMTALHYGIYGRLSSLVEIPCTWIAKQLVNGNIVKVTHELVPDVQNGAIGVTEKIGVIEGRVSPRTTDKPDVLTVRFQPGNRASGISPSALGDSWSVGTYELTFSDADDPIFAQDGGNDLDGFTAGDDVLLWEWDTASPTGSYPLSATINTINTSTKKVTFTADPFSGAGLPASGAVVMTFCSWDDMTAAQKLWLAIAGTDYTLGTAEDEGFQWGV